MIFFLQILTIVEIFTLFSTINPDSLNYYFICYYFRAKLKILFLEKKKKLK